MHVFHPCNTLVTQAHLRPPLEKHTGKATPLPSTTMFTPTMFTSQPCSVKGQLTVVHHEGLLELRYLGLATGSAGSGADPSGPQSMRTVLLPQGCYEATSLL